MEILNFKNAVDINFQNIVDNKLICDNELINANNIMKNIKETYSDLLNNISNSSAYLGIDSFNFQNKQFDSQLNYLKKNFTSITNRIYGDYYKIYKQIKKYVECVFIIAKLITAQRL